MPTSSKFPQIALRCRNLYHANELLLDVLEESYPKTTAVKPNMRTAYQQRSNTYKECFALLITHLVRTLTTEQDEAPLRTDFVSGKENTTVCEDTGESNKTREGAMGVTPAYNPARDDCREDRGGEEVCADGISTRLTPEMKNSSTELTDPTTPCLENWKLSDATRRIVHGQADFEHVARGFRKQKVSSPVTPGLPETTITTRAKLEEQSFIESSSPVTPEMPEDIKSIALAPRPRATMPFSMETTQCSTPEMRAAPQHNPNCTPPTPDMLTSPLRTTHIQPVVAHSSEGSLLSKGMMLGKVRDYDSDEEIDLTHILEDMKPVTPLRTNSAKKSKVFHDDEDNELPYPVSPPKAKLLVPSKCAMAEGQAGWIPAITEQEYALAPTFLRMQVTNTLKLRMKRE